MQFVYPWFLTALASIAIPIVIHLFHFRRYKQLVFPDIRFLKQVQEQTQRNHKLKDLLVLLSRILLIAALVFAFAQPYLPATKGMVSGAKAIFIFVDNSYSMEQQGNEGPLLEQAKNKARAIIDSYEPSAVFQIGTHLSDGKYQRFVNATEAIQLIDEVTAKSGSINLEWEMERMQQQLKQSGKPIQIGYFISDFQQQMGKPNTASIDSAVWMNWVPIATNELNNLYLDSAWCTSPLIQPNKPIALNCLLRNSGDAKVDQLPVSLFVNGIQKGLQNTSIDAKGTSRLTFTINANETEPMLIEFRIQDAVIPFDNHLYGVLTPTKTIEVLAINTNKPNPYIQTVLELDPVYKLQQMPAAQLDYANWSSKQCIFLLEPTQITSGQLEELQKYVNQGGQLVIVPPANVDMNMGLNSLLMSLQMPVFDKWQTNAVQVQTFNLKDVLFREVFLRLPQQLDLPKVTSWYDLASTANTRGNALITMANEKPLAWKGNYGRGTVIVFATPFTTATTNLVKHALFVPLVLKMGMGKQTPRAMYSKLGVGGMLMLPNNSAKGLYAIRNQKQIWVAEAINQDGRLVLSLQQPFTQSGWYQITPNNSEKVLLSMALNDDRKESELAVWSIADIEAMLGAWPKHQLYKGGDVVLKQAIANQLKGVPLWRYCVVLALVFALIEILLLRLLK